MLTSLFKNLTWTLAIVEQFVKTDEKMPELLPDKQQVEAS